MALTGVLFMPLAGQAAEPTIHVVRIQDFAFVPARLEVMAGDAVVWVNEDLAPHTATGGDPHWDTGSLARGRSQTLPFTLPGIFAYRCLYHPQMRGVIVVGGRADWNASPLPSAPPAR